MSKFRVGHTKAAKLTPSQVYELRQRYEDGATQGSLAREYGISIGQIGRIVRGESWNQYNNPAKEQPQEISEEELLRRANEAAARTAQLVPEIITDEEFMRVQGLRKDSP